MSEEKNILEETASTVAEKVRKTRRNYHKKENYKQEEGTKTKRNYKTRTPKIMQEVKDGEVVESRARVKVVKNKVAPPFREAEFDIIYGKGISKSGNILDLGVNLGIVDKSGSWFGYNGERIGQGRENAKKYLEDNPKIMEDIEAKVRKNFDEAFYEPTKVIGRYMSKEDAEIEVKKGNYVKEDPGKGFRRVVAAPKPIDIGNCGQDDQLVTA